MDCEQAQISFSIEPGHCILCLAGALGVVRSHAGITCAFKPNRLLTRAARHAHFDRAATVRERSRSFETFDQPIFARRLSAEELRQTALELRANRKDVIVDWSGATQLDAVVAQVRLSLRAGLGEQNNSLSSMAIPSLVQGWPESAGLTRILAEAVEVP
jgi:hypothetical protein